MKIMEADLAKGLWALPSFPVVLVTVGDNIMTAGAFHFYSFEPPSVMVGIIRSRYTYKLIREYREFGVNLPGADQVGLVRLSGSISGAEGADKYQKGGVTRRKAAVIRSHLIEECPVNIECGVVHEIPYPGSHQWYVGEIKAVHINDDYRKEQGLMFWGNEYRKVGEFLENAW